VHSSASLRELFESAIELAADARASFLDDHCATPALRAQVERLLAADAMADLLFAGGAQAAAAAIGDPGDEPALPGTLIGPFELVAVLGQGGSSTVFHARREVAGVLQEVALKVLRHGLYAPDAQRQFRRERQALAQLRHPGIARLIEGGITTDGTAYIALDLVEGKPIVEYARERVLDLRARLALFLQVCRAVEAAHRALIVHRDLKPTNVLVTDDGQVKLLDFGIAKLLENDDETRTETAAFTPAYAAPEQRNGGQITTATDVYALGILLGELVTGQRLGAGAGQEPKCREGHGWARAARTPSSHITGEEAAGVLPASPTITRRALRGDLDNIVLKAIETEPERRYASAGALADDVARMLEGRPVAAHPPSRLYRIGKFVQRHRGAVAATVLCVLALLVAFGVAVWEAKVARDAERGAVRDAARANATKDFLVRVFRATDPRIAQDKPRGQITAKELLDLNAPHIAEEFAGDADTQIELLGVAASIYRELDEPARYDDLHQQQTQLARNVYGETHPAIIAGLLEDIDHANERNDYARANGLLKQADALIKRAGLNDSVLRARWYVLRTITPLPDDDTSGDGGDHALESAANLYARYAPADPGHVKALTTLGFHALAQDPALAEPYFLRAIAVTQKSGSRNDALLQQFAYPGLGQARESRGDYSGALSAYEQAAELARKTYGETHSSTWVPAAEYAWRLHRNGDRAQALRLFEHLLQIMPADWSRDSYAQYAREFYADRLSAEGRAAEAIPLLEAAQKFYLAHPGVPYELRRNRLVLGDAYDRAGRSDDARAQLKTSLDERVAKDPPAHRTVLSARERWGRFLLEHGEVDGAEVEFREVLARAQDRTLEAIALAHAGMARLALAQGNARQAIDASRHAMEIFDRVTGVRDVRSQPYLWLVRAQALRASGDETGAREWAQRALDASRHYDDPSAASIREAEAVVQATTQS
jgi:serine/threonine-protein kinase